MEIEISEFNIEITKTGKIGIKISMEIRTGFASYMILTERDIGGDKSIDEVKKELLEELISKDFENFSKSLKGGQCRFAES